MGLPAGYAGLLDVDLGTGVLRFAPDGSMGQVATLPIDESGAFHMVKGLAFHDGFLYAGDIAGAVWRFVPQAGSNVTLDTPWLQDQLLEPITEEGGGVNGITFRGDVLLAVDSAAGTVLRAPLGRDGSPGRLSVVASDPSLVTADGITLDTDGGLWVTVNGTEANPTGSIARVGRNGTVETLALDPTSLNYPTQAVFDRTYGMNGTLYVANGNLPAIGNGTNVIAFEVGPHGQPMP